MGDITITRNSPAAEDILRDVWELYYGIIVRHEDNRIAASGLPVYDGAQAMVKGLMAVVYPDYDPDLVLDVAIDIGELPTRDALDYRLQF